MEKLKPVLKYLAGIALAIVLVILGLLFIKYITEPNVTIKDLKLTNVTDTSVTVTWVTNEPSVSNVMLSENNDFDVLSTFSKARFYDDRDSLFYSWLLDNPVERYTHHVTITQLTPNTKYYYRVSTGIKEVPYTYTQIETAPVLDSLRTPDPSYGSFSADTTDDSIVYYTMGTDPVSSVYSTYLNDGRAFSFDKSNVRNLEKTEVYAYKDGTVINLKLVNVAQTSDFSSTVGKDQPMSTLGGVDSTEATTPTSLNRSVLGEVNAQYAGCTCTKACPTNGGCIEVTCNGSSQGINGGESNCPAQTIQTCGNGYTYNATLKQCDKGNTGTGTAGTGVETNDKNDKTDVVVKEAPTTDPKPTTTGTTTTTKNTPKGTVTTNKTVTYVKPEFSNIVLDETVINGVEDPVAYCDGLAKKGGSIKDETVAACCVYGTPEPEKVDTDKVLGDCTTSGRSYCGTRTTWWVSCTQAPKESDVAEDKPVEKLTDICKADDPETICTLDKVISCPSGEVSGSESQTFKDKCDGKSSKTQTNKQCTKTKDGVIFAEVTTEAIGDGKTSKIVSVKEVSGDCTGKPAYVDISANPDIKVVTTVPTTNPAVAVQDVKCEGNDPNSCDTKTCQYVSAQKCNILGTDNKPVDGTRESGCMKKDITPKCIPSSSTVTNPTPAPTPTPVEPTQTTKEKCISDGDDWSDTTGQCTTVTPEKRCKNKGGTWQAGIFSCIYPNGYNLNKNLTSQVLAQSVLGTSDDAVTTIKVSDAGTYKVTEVKGYTVDQSQVKVADTKGTNDTLEIKFFVDTNKDGIKQDTEVYVTGNVEVKLDKISDIETYNLVEGWNLIGYGMKVTGMTKASDLLNEISSQGGYATHLATFRNGSWVMFTQRGTSKFGTDFNLIPGEGYFVRVYKKSGLVLEGQKMVKNSQYFLSNGWNLLSLATLKGMKATQVLDSVNKVATLKADVLTRYEGGKYENVVKDDKTVYGNDYDIKSNAGYFMRLKKGGAIWQSE